MVNVKSEGSPILICHFARISISDQFGTAPESLGIAEIISWYQSIISAVPRDSDGIPTFPDVVCFKIADSVGTTLMARNA